MVIPELLAPAGNLEKLKAAVIYGADAVYLGGRQFGLRAGAENFTRQEMALGVEFAHRRGARVYVTVNVFARNRDLELLPGYLAELRDLGVDAIIASDPGVLTLSRQLVPEIPVHLSTQANTTNWAAASFWQACGVKRIVLARELSREEIQEIRRRVDIPLEVFVHGAMCISYSGRCLLSNYMTGRDANRGDCAQACRWRYALVEEKRPGEFFPISEDERGSYILSSKDLCLLEYIPDLAAAKVDSLKIEGRMKSLHYVATVVNVYRQALDAYRADPEHFQVAPSWWDELGKVSNRDYTTGFFTGTANGSMANSAVEGIYRRSYTFVGVVLDYDWSSGLTRVEQRNRFAVDEELEALVPGGKIFYFRVRDIYDENGIPCTAAPHPRQKVYISTGCFLPPYSILRRRNK